MQPVFHNVKSEHPDLRYGHLPLLYTLVGGDGGRLQNVRSIVGLLS
jgi:hypothetical protein